MGLVLPAFQKFRDLPNVDHLVLGRLEYDAENADDEDPHTQIELMPKPGFASSAKQVIWDHFGSAELILARICL